MSVGMIVITVNSTVLIALAILIETLLRSQRERWNEKLAQRAM